MPLLNLYLWSNMQLRENWQFTLLTVSIGRSAKPRNALSL